MHYATSISFNGSLQKAFDRAFSVLTANGFAITDKAFDAIELTGPGMHSNRQSAILGATRIRIRHEPKRLVLAAELGGVASLRRFLFLFPLAMATGFVVLFGLVMGAVFGAQTGVGFGVPEASGWKWLAWTVPLAILPLSPWLVLSPLMARSIKNKTIKALDTLISNMRFTGEDVPPVHPMPPAK